MTHTVFSRNLVHHFKEEGEVHSKLVSALVRSEFGSHALIGRERLSERQCRSPRWRAPIASHGIDRLRDPTVGWAMTREVISPLHALEHFWNNPSIAWDVPGWLTVTHVREDGEGTPRRVDVPTRSRGAGPRN